MSQKSLRVHFIAIGGSAMHQLAIALKNKGYQVSGSDDEIFDPALSNLKNHDLLPASNGWFPEKISNDLDFVVLGMHAKIDNPELIQAQKLNLKVLSYPEFIYQESMDKQRIVIAGSHGKTTTTAMIMHILNFHGRKFDYLVGAKIPGFEYSVKITDDAPLLVVEGDEYYASVLEQHPKFLYYHHHIGVVNGISWDHMNVFPTEHLYVRQFDHFADATPKAGVLIFNEEDAIAAVICQKEREDVTPVEFSAHKAEISNGHTYLVTPQGTKIKVNFFGNHNLQNISAAKAVTSRLGITDDMFYEAISSFKGASNRLEQIAANSQAAIFKDFAHAPSKLEATTKAIKKQFPGRKLIACLELHTFSSLNKAFLPQYADCFNSPDKAIVYYNPEVIKHKNLEALSKEELINAFKRNDLLVFTDAAELEAYLLKENLTNSNLLLMSSGNFGNINLHSLANTLIKS